jgi:hypothetical protein
MNTPTNSEALPPTTGSASFEWQDATPEHDGEYYYAGETPDGTDVVAIVGITTIREGRHAYLYIPPGWRGDPDRQQCFHGGPLSEWHGQWAGPERGLTCVTA